MSPSRLVCRGSLMAFAGVVMEIVCLSTTGMYVLVFPLPYFLHATPSGVVAQWPPFEVRPYYLHSIYGHTMSLMAYIHGHCVPLLCVFLSWASELHGMSQVLHCHWHTVAHGIRAEGRGMTTAML